ncbi:MAG: hypothetical protein J7K04_00015 [Spirochaetales bacterium]|nr:hypothetical protein [Spirochaetales bacterium]
MKKSIFITVIITTATAILLFLSGCSRFYSAEIAGYIKDSNSGNGINGAIIRMYLEEPEAANSDNFIVETASMVSGGNNGYFNHKIMWETWNAKFGDEGDSGTIWLGVTHDDYSPAIIKVSGIISDSVNLVPDIKLDRATFSSPTVTGRVVNVNGEGVNGVRIVLDLASTTDEDQDYITTTATINGNTGTYEFRNVTWRDDSPDSEDSDTEDITLIIDDPDYTASGSLSAIITSDQDNNIQYDITVSRKPRTDFSANVTGTCIFKTTKTDGEVQKIPIPGITVQIDYLDDNGSHKLYDTTDSNGNYSLLIQWTDSTPTNDPEGEDELPINVSYTDPSSTYTFNPLNNYTIRSWINPNTLPESEGS